MSAAQNAISVSNDIIPLPSADDDIQSEVKKPSPLETANQFADRHLPTKGKVFCWGEKDAEGLFKMCWGTKDEVINALVRNRRDGVERWIGLASFSRKERKAPFAEYRRSIFAEVDVWASPAEKDEAVRKSAKGGRAPIEKYDSIEEAAQAVNDFILGNNLPVPTFIRSGGGIHLHWPLNEDASVALVKPVEDKLKRLAKLSGFNIDFQCTGDMARIVRLPGSVNWKLGKDYPRPVVLGALGEPLTLIEIEAAFDRALDGAKNMPGEAPQSLFRDEKNAAAMGERRLDKVTENLMGRGPREWTPLLEADLRAALKLVPSGDRVVWITVLLLLVPHGESAWPLFDEWSRENDNGGTYKAVESREKWKQEYAACDKSETGKVAGIFTLAKDYGWKSSGADREAATLSADEKSEQLRTLGSERLAARLGDVIAAMSCPDIAGVRLAYDTFTGPSISDVENNTWREFTDADAIELRVRLESKCFKTVSGQMARDALTGLMGRNQIDTAQLWAEGLPPWDGVSRVDDFMTKHFGAEDNAYARSVSRYMWSAMAGRLLEPGAKCDMVVILVGAQGGGKSTGVMSMCPNPEAFAELSFHKADDDTKRLLRGRLIVEIAELAGMGKRDAETLKQFLSARFDMWRPNYHEGMARYERRCIFIGTSNRDDFLKDPTGHRRFLPIKVGKADIEAIQRDRDQLWAEGITLFNKYGVLFARAEELAKDEHEEFEQSNSLAERIERDLKARAPMGLPRLWDSPCLKLDDVMALLDIPPRDMARMQQEVCNALRALGYEKTKRRWEGEKPAWRWVRQREGV